MLKDSLKRIFSRFRPPRQEEAPPQFAFDGTMNAKTLTKDAMDIIGDISSLGPRLSLSKEERMAGNRVASKLEEFGLEPGFDEFRGENMTQLLWGRAVGFSLPLVPLLIMMGQPFFALLLSLGISAVYWFDGVMEKGIFSRFMKKKTGANVTASISPEEPKATVLFSSHLDSARIHKTGNANRALCLAAASLALGLVLSLFMTIYELFKGQLFGFNFNIWVNIFVTFPLLALSVCSIGTASLYSGEVSPGVGDDLSGVGACLALAKYFSSKKPANVKVDFAFFSSEETGKAGSRHYFSSKEKDGTVVINIDAIYGKEDLSLLLSDGNGMVKLDGTLVRELEALSVRMGYRMKTGKLSFLSGSTDAMNAAGNGFSSTTVTSMVPGSVNPGHTQGDTVGSIDPAALESVIAVLIRYVEDEDRKYAPDGAKKEESGFLSSDRTYLLTHT